MCDEFQGVGSTMKRPAALTVVGWLFVLFGIGGLISMVAAPLAGKGVRFDVNVIGLWVGPGLLRMEEGSRRWALWYIRFGLVVAPITVVLLALMAPDRLPLRLFDETPLGTVPRFVVLLVLSLIWAVALWEHAVLQRSEVRALFSERGTTRPAASERVVVGVCLTLGALVFLGVGHDFHLHFDLNGGVGPKRIGGERRVVVLQDAAGRRWTSTVDSGGSYSLSGWRPRMPAVLFVCDLAAPGHADLSAISYSGTDWIRDGLRVDSEQAKDACRDLAKT